MPVTTRSRRKVASPNAFESPENATPKRTQTSTRKSVATKESAKKVPRRSQSVSHEEKSTPIRRPVSKIPQTTIVERSRNITGKRRSRSSFSFKDPFHDDQDWFKDAFDAAKAREELFPPLEKSIEMANIEFFNSRIEEDTPKVYGQFLLFVFLVTLFLGVINYAWA